MKERLVAIGFVVFALVFFAGSYVLKVGSLAQPGPGFMPTAVAVAILVVAVYNLVLCFRQSLKEKTQSAGFGLLPAGVAAATLIYPILLRSLDFLIATFLVMSALLLFLRFKSRPVSIVTALVTTFVAFIFFGKMLGVVLPTGILEEAILAL